MLFTFVFIDRWRRPALFAIAELASIQTFVFISAWQESEPRALLQTSIGDRRGESGDIGFRACRREVHLRLSNQTGLEFAAGYFF